MTDIMPNGGVPDTFTGSNGAAWNATNWAIALNQGSGGSVTIQGNQGRITTGTVAFNRTSVRLLTAARLDQEVVFDWVVPVALSEFPYLYLRSPSAVDTASGYYFSLGANDMTCGYGETTNTYNGVDIVTYTHGFVAGQVVRTRVAVFGGTGTKTLKARTWLASGTEDTSTWQISATDTHTVNTAGFVGITTSSGSTGSKNFFIDNFDAFDVETPSQKTISVGGSITATGTLTKKVPKLFTGSITPTGALTKMRVVVRLFTGSITATGTFIKVPRKAFAGSITTTGLLVKVPHKAFSGSITAAGTLKRRTNKIFSGTITAVGSLTLTSLGRVFGAPGIVVVTIRKAGELRARFRRT
jgi:hypothetical protein